MKYLIVLHCLLLAATPSAQKQHSLTDCLAPTDAHLPPAQQQPLIEAAHRAALSQLRSNYLPQASLGGQATWQTEVTSLPISFPGIEVPTLSKDQYRFTLDLTQSIWDGGQNSGLTAVQKAQTKAEIQRVQVDRYAAREQTMQLFCAALLAQKQAEALAATKKDLLVRKERLAEQVNNGTAIPANVEAFELRLLELEQQEEEARSRTASAADGLSLLTGLSIQPSDVLLPPIEASTAAEIANNRPELGLFSLQQQLTQSQEKLSAAKTMPRLNAVATLGYARPGLNFLSNEFSPYGIFGLNFKWNLHPLYTGSAQNEKEQLRLQSARIDAQRAQFLLQNDLRVQQQTRDIERLQKVLERDQTIIRLRDNLVGTANVQLDNGIITASDYLTETTNATNARLTATIHEIQLMQANLQLLFITGNL
ncbi:MAG: TolC family protein [Lewinellaceae bacterium]|nr:TolC family protein [Lewinellaceae bacterium]